jgi:hypothetical protein
MTGVGQLETERHLVLRLHPHHRGRWPIDQPGPTARVAWRMVLRIFAGQEHLSVDRHGPQAGSRESARLHAIRRDLQWQPIQTGQRWALSKPSLCGRHTIAEVVAAACQSFAARSSPSALGWVNCLLLNVLTLCNSRWISAQAPPTAIRAPSGKALIESFSGSPDELLQGGGGHQREGVDSRGLSSKEADGYGRCVAGV